MLSVLGASNNNSYATSDGEVACVCLSVLWGRLVVSGGNIYYSYYCEIITLEKISCKCSLLLTPLKNEVHLQCPNSESTWSAH